MAGLFEKIKDFYLRLEDLYYSMLDKVDAKVPIYGVIDRVDRVVPSFLLLIIIAALAVGGIAFALLGGIAAPATLAVTVLDEQDSPIEGASITATFFGGSAQGVTGSDGAATLSVPLGAVVDLLITKDDFEDKTSRVTVSKVGQEESITLRSLVPLPTEKTLQFVDGAGRKLAGVNVSASFSCSNAGVAAPAPVVVTTAELKITPPKGCGIFTVTATASNYRSASYAVEQSMQIMLDALAAGQGSLKITVSDAQTGAAVNGIKVVLNNDTGIVDTRYTDFGEVLFPGIVPAEYYVTVEDEKGDYGSETVRQITVAPNEITRREAQISRSVKANLSVSAKDKASKAAIADAEITLYTADGLAVSMMKTGSNGVANFAVREAAQYFLRGFHEAYLVSELVSVDLSTATGGVQKSAALEMEKMTSANSGRVQAKVIDEDNKPVENATVSLFDAETDFLSGYKPQATDANGIANFVGVKAGKYYALAQKFPASGKSGPITVDARTLNELAISMVIGTATVEIKAVDADDAAVPFAVAEIKAESGEALGSIALDAAGTGSKALKADKRVFVTVSREGYANYTSAAVQLFKDQKIAIKAVLENEIIGDMPKVILVGLYSGNSEALTLEADNKYTAKLQIRVPAGKQYSQLGVHFRAGDKESVDKDKIFINAVNAPGSAYILGKTYNPPNGWSKDSASITNADAKWANIWWDGNIAQGVYNIEVEVRVRSETVQGSAIPIHYRAWAVGTTGTYLRDPEDAALGTSPGTSGKPALYAQTYTRNYFEGAKEQCDGKFCFSSRLFNPAEGLYASGPPYTVKVFQDYDFAFSITNDSPAVHDNAELRIRNTKDGTRTDNTLRIRSYSITNADAQVFESTTEAFETDSIQAGYFIQNKTLLGDMALQPAKVDKSNMELKVVSEGMQAFVNAVGFNVVNEEDLVPEVKPDVLAAYTNIGLNVHVTYKGGNLAGLDVEGALVRVVRITPDRAETAQTAITDQSGIAKFDIPASSPNTKIKVQVEKPGYASSEVEKIVTCSVIEFRESDDTVIDDQNPIKSSLNLLQRTEDEIPLKAISLVPQAISIERLEVVDAEPGGVFHGLLDTQTMNMFLSLYRGIEFSALGQEKGVSVKTKLSDYAMDEVGKNEKLSGFLKGTLGGPAFTQTCEFTLPLEVGIALVPPPEDTACLDIDQWEWKEAIVGSILQKQITITNNCTSGGGMEPDVDVSSLKAELTWKSNEYGEVWLTVTDPTIGSAWTTELEERRMEVFSDVLKAGEEYTAILEFRPYSQYLTDKPTEPATFGISLEADVYKGAGDTVQGNTDIAAELTFVDAAHCVKVVTETESGSSHSVSRVEIAENETSATFDIDTSDCAVEMDVRLCAYDNGKCSGGAPEGSIRLDPWDIDNVSPDQPETITVTREDIPGYYDIEIEVKPEGSVSWQKVMLLPVIIRPDGLKHATSANYFSMPFDYKVTLMGAGTSEIISLKNNYMAENVAVTANMCDWGDSTAAFNYGSMEYIIGGSTALISAGVVAVSVALASHIAASTAAATASGLIGAGAVTAATGTTVTVGVATAAGTGVGAAGVGGAAATATGTAVITGISTGGIALIVIAAVLLIDTILAAILPGYDGMIGMLMEALMPLFGGAYDCSEHYDTKPVSDLIINLPDDFVGAKLEFGDPAADGGIAMDLNAAKNAITARDEDMPSHPTDPNLGVLPTAEEVPLTFTNNSYENPEPVYGIFSITVNEHVHGDTLHLEPAVECVDGDTFGPGHIWCGGGGKCYLTDSESCGVLGTQAIVTTNPEFSDAMPPLVTTAKFHLRFDTHPFETGIPDVEFDTMHCTRGAMIGAIGDTAPLPMLKYDWSWGESGIGVDYCDAGSADPMYCDATQFTIMLNKRLYALYHFLEVNNFELPCPPESTGRQIDEFNSDNSTYIVPSGKIGMNSIAIELEGENATISATVENNTDMGQSGTVRIVTATVGASANAGDCTINFGISASGTANDTQTVSCEVTGLTEETIYTTGAVVQTADSTASIDGLPVKAMFLIEAADGGECWLESKTTDPTGGKSAILPWVQYGGVQWTADVPNVDALDRLVNFEAYLMRDGFTDDFMKDFMHYYTVVNFADTPSYFNGLGYDLLGRTYGFATLFDNSAMAIGNKWDVTQNTLSSPGLYKVYVAAIFLGEDWRFFDGNGLPRVGVVVLLEKISDPGIPSPFYWMPMDGFVGVGPDYTMDRQGYGTTFTNADTTKLVQFDNSASPFKTYPNAGSNPVVPALAKVEEGFKAINTAGDTYGTLLNVRYKPDGTAEITLAPQYATPVMMKVSMPQPSDEEFGAFYSAVQSNTPVDTGTTLTRWEGAGNCRDFSSMAVWEKFNSTYDRRATQQDLPMNWMNTYGVGWDEVVEYGDVFLRTIFYTPAKTSNSLKAMQPADSMEFITPDSTSDTIALNGIQGMPFNSQGDFINSVEDVFQMVEDGIVCLTPTTTSAKFWWSPKAVYDAQGSAVPYVTGGGTYTSDDCAGQASRSIHCETASLEGGVNCIE